MFGIWYMNHNIMTPWRSIKPILYLKCLVFDIWTTTTQKVPSNMCAQYRVRSPAHSRSLLRRMRSLPRTLTGRILDSQGCNVSSCGQRRFWLDCTYAQADLSLCLGHMSESMFSKVAAAYNFDSCEDMLIQAKRQLESPFSVSHHGKVTSQ